MSSFWLHDGKRYNVGRAFSYGDINYTTAGATAETFASLGFTEVQIQPRPDDRFYIVSGPDDAGKYNATPRDLAELKKSFVAEQESQQGSLLAASDWMITRKQETGKEVPADWSTYRQSVRDVGDARVAKINGVKSIAKLEELIKAPAEVPVDPADPDAGMKPNPAPHLDPYPLDPDAMAEAAAK